LAEAVVWQDQRIDPTGFYWRGARYYDPLAGRFLSPDPAGYSGSTWDLYAFCDNDHINKFDPDGRLAKSLAYGIGDVMDHYSTMANNALDVVLNPIVGLFDPVAAKRFSGD